MADRFLPGVPGKVIEAAFNAACGDEIRSGKFDNPNSSAALAANAFGYFLHRAGDLPPLPGCEDMAWPARSLGLEATVCFPWEGGRHPVLDVLVTTGSALIGIESKRFEPFRGVTPSDLSSAYWRPVWGEHMTGYASVRDRLRDGHWYSRLDAAQLFKHAFALRTAVAAGPYRGLTPVLFYIHAEPDSWAGTGQPVDERALVIHRQETDDFAARVVGDDVLFVVCTYRKLLAGWAKSRVPDIRAHAAAVSERYRP